MALAISFGEGVLDGVWLALAVLLLQVAGAAVVLTLLLRQVQPVQEVLGKVADIAGFWPVRASSTVWASYRNRVVAGLGSQLESAGATRVALVAHSQGSVLAAWLLAGSEKARLDGIGTGERHLVTTGSPLASLYAVFFPGYFPPGWFAILAGRCTSWVNFWRPTDPIGFPVAGAVNVELPAVDADGDVRGHGRYWDEPEIVDHVQRLAAWDDLSAESARNR